LQKKVTGRIPEADFGAESVLEPQQKTIDEHAEFLREYVRLQLWFMWTWLRRHPDESFRYVIRNRVDIFRKTDLNKGPSKNTSRPRNFSDPGWTELENAAYQIYLHEKDTTAERFEQEAWNIFRRVVEARVERDFNEGDGLEGYQCGSLRYHDLRRFLSYKLTAGLSYLTRGVPRKVFFHIGNRVSPRSIFADREYLPRCFFQLMRETREKYCAGALRTKTWLNSYPKWLELFPQQWQENLTPPSDDVDWSQSSWGQFITARGTFNHKYGDALRQTGKLPFAPRSSWCTFASMEGHLREYLNTK
jgi:hypothetical protein